MAAYDDFARAQIARQTELWTFEPHTTLDFTPFEAELRAIQPDRLRAIGAAVRGATVPVLSALLRSNQLSSAELVLHYVDRIARFSWLRAVLELNPDALNIARALDAAGDGPRGPLHGIPILIKDNIGTGDRMHNTAGAVALAGSRCDRDAFLVQRLRAAGAVILGKTNLSEWANYMADSDRQRGLPPNGFSAMGGQTRNPYGAFDVGGSSSGSAAATAASLAAAAVGTETYGSIVFPALRNALFGLKPSLGLLSRDRIIPITDATDTAGPMARCMTDLAVLMNGLAGLDLRDAACAELAESSRGQALVSADFTRFLRADGLRGMRLGVLASDNWRPGSEPLTIAARDALVRAGATLIDAQIGDLDFEFMTLLDHGFKHGVAEYLHTVGAQAAGIADVIAFNEADPARRAPNGLGRMKAANERTMGADEYAALKREGRAQARQLIRASLSAGQLDALVCFDQSGTGPQFVMAGAPLLTIPIGYLESGEPVGLTLCGEPFDDGKLIAAGYALERLLAAHREPAL